MQVKKKNSSKGLFKTSNPLLASFLILLILLPFYLFSRLTLLFFSGSLFPPASFLEMLSIIIGGLRFDVSAILMINLPFLFFFNLPVTWHQRKGYRFFYKLLFVVGNVFGILVNLVDSVYFRFTQKRMTGDFFNYMKAGGQDMIQLLPQYIHDFWYLSVILIMVIVGLIIFIFKVKAVPLQMVNFKSVSLGILYFILMLGLAVIGIRGGLQLKPVTLVTAGLYAPLETIPLVLNTPFTIIKTWNQNEIQKVSYFRDEDSLNKVFNPVQKGSDDPWTRKNVIIIILESFSSEHSAFLNPDLEKQGYKGYTPFLDSLMEQSLVFKGVANGKRSIEGIPAIVASIPSWMNNDYITSSYAGNNINTLSNLLGRKGYQTSFFHGGNNGTMNFDDFATLAGFENYFGRDEYANDGDFDGEWGIYDEPFFQFFVEEMNRTKQPFLSVLFSLSSHHPYKVPEKLKGKFPRGKLEIQESVGYTDYSLKKLFDKAARLPWFENTLFVITADHTSEADQPYYKTRAGAYSIPIIFYQKGSGLQGYDDRIAQQLDIMPSVLDYLGFREPFLSFGSSVFDTHRPRYALTFLNNSYMLFRDSRMLIFSDGMTTGLYDLKSDPMQKINLVGRDPKEQNLLLFLKAVIQQYNNRVIYNELTIKS